MGVMPPDPHPKLSVNSPLSIPLLGGATLIGRLDEADHQPERTVGSWETNAGSGETHEQIYDPALDTGHIRGGEAVKVIEEYLENALAFEQLAAVEIDPALKDDFEKQAVSFRKLAAERAKRLGLGPPENSN